MFFFQAEDGIRDLVRSRGLGDVYKRQAINNVIFRVIVIDCVIISFMIKVLGHNDTIIFDFTLLF